jgi:hypothetical protein
MITRRDRVPSLRFFCEAVRFFRVLVPRFFVVGRFLPVPLLGDFPPFFAPPPFFVAIVAFPDETGLYRYKAVGSHLLRSQDLT